jgi:hypothetical protein
LRIRGRLVSKLRLEESELILQFTDHLERETSIAPSGSLHSARFPALSRVRGPRPVSQTTHFGRSRGGSAGPLRRQAATMAAENRRIRRFLEVAARRSQPCFLLWAVPREAHPARKRAGLPYFGAHWRRPPDGEQRPPPAQFPATVIRSIRMEPVRVLPRRSTSLPTA